MNFFFLAMGNGFRVRPEISAKRPMYYLTGNSGELEHMQCLVEHTGTLVHIDNHRGLPLTYKEVLEQSRQLAVSEWHYSWVVSENLGRLKLFEPLHENTNNLGFRPCLVQSHKQARSLKFKEGFYYLCSENRC